MNTYEGLFIFDSSLSDDVLADVLAKMGEEITRLGGEVRETAVLGKKLFARPLKKRESGIYVRIGFSLAGDKVDALLARYHLNEAIFRMQITRQDPRPVVPVTVDEAEGQA